MNKKLNPGRSKPDPLLRLWTKAVASFTYVELVVALGIAAIVLTAAVLGFGTITSSRLVSVQSADIRLATSTSMNFFSSTNTFISVPQAPNYGALAQAEILRERLYSDISSAAAIFLLGRNGLNTTRITSLAFTNDGRSVMTPQAFRALLPNAADFSSTTTNSVLTTNSSLYILNPGTLPADLSIRCIYETDLIEITSPAGVYASVRRYQGTAMTDYYHIFYPSQTNTFRPTGYIYPMGTVNSVAVTWPFYLVWWPDPIVDRLPTPTAGGQGKASYTNMADQTSFFFTVPAFPSQ